MNRAEYDKKLRGRLNQLYAIGLATDLFQREPLDVAIAAIRALNDEACGKDENAFLGGATNMDALARNEIRQEIKGIIGGTDGE